MAGKEENKRRALQSEEEENIDKEEQMTSEASGVDKAEKQKRPRGRPRNAERVKEDDNRRIDDFLEAKKSDAFSRSILTTRSPSNQKETGARVDESILREWMEEIKETMSSNKADLMEEMIKGISKLSQQINKIELEAAKKEKRWEMEKAELLDKINILEQRMKVAEEKSQNQEPLQGTSADAINHIAVQVEKKLRTREIIQPEIGRKKDLENVIKYVEDNEKKEKKNNLVIRGLVLKSNHTKNEVSAFLRDELEVEVKVQDAYEVGRDRKCVIVKMESWEDKKSVLINKKKLGQQKIFIDNDLTAKERDIQRELVGIMKEERNNGTASKVGYQKIMIRDQWISYADVVRRRTHNLDF